MRILVTGATGKVGSRLGFETLSHFSDSFKKKFGMPPSMVRQHSNDYVFKI